MSDLQHVEFSSEIVRTAATLGREPAPERVAALQEVLRTAGRIDTETGALTVEFGREQVPLASYLDSEVAKFDAVAVTASSEQKNGFVKRMIGSTTAWRRADDALVIIDGAFKAADAARTAAEVATWRNPWRKGAENRTRQTIINNTNPALAARFKAEARV